MTKTQPVVLVNPETRRAFHFTSYAAAATYLNSDGSTVCKAATGKRKTVSGHIAIRVELADPQHRMKHTKTTKAVKSAKSNTKKTAKAAR